MLYILISIFLTLAIIGGWHIIQLSVCGGPERAMKLRKRLQIVKVATIVSVLLILINIAL